MKKVESGCTLIEALVALSVLAVGIMLFVQTSLVSLKSASAGRRNTRNLAVAAEWIELLRLGPWQEAVSGCERVDDAAARRETAFCRVERGGEAFNLSLERSLQDPLVERLTVQCSGPRSHGDRSVTLETAVERGR